MSIVNRGHSDPPVESSDEQAPSVVCVWLVWLACCAQASAHDHADGAPQRSRVESGRQRRAWVRINWVQHRHHRRAVFKLDPGRPRVQRRPFRPAFAASTTSVGRVSVGVNFKYAKYNRLDDRSMDRLQLGAVKATTPAVARTGFTSMELSSKTLVISGSVGVTDKLDVGVAVPLISVKVDGNSWVENGNGQVVLAATGRGVSSGIGDIAAPVKYRLLAFGTGEPDPGGLAVIGTLRMPSGDDANLRGLGITRPPVSLTYSSGRRLRPRQQRVVRHDSVTSCRTST